ncbi:UNVERIFIED_CONTAM: transposase [Streptococcus canis]|uniref:Transposase n=1 Tax=Streptococcus canis TaxID=1329 RepID=A0AAE4Q4P7_STRCB|nr:transposase [Streptococcus canis]
MSGFKCYDEEFKQFLVNLYQTGKIQTELCKDYGISHSALARWIKQYPQVKLDDDTIAVFMQIQIRTCDTDFVSRLTC